MSYLYKILNPNTIKGIILGITISFIAYVVLTSSSNSIIFGIVLGLSIFLIVYLSIRNFNLINNLEKSTNRQDELELTKLVLEAKELKDKIWTNQDIDSEYISSLKLSNSINHIKTFIIGFASRIIATSTLITIVGGILSFSIFYATYQQVNLLDQQNTRLDIQNQLVEANRRSSSFFLLSNIMQDVNAELNKETNFENRLTKGLLGQIIATVGTLQPYRFIEPNGELSEYLSPERGQFLSYLLNSEIHKDDLSHIIANADFTYSKIKKLHFDSLLIGYLNLDNSNIDDLKIWNSKFVGNLELNKVNIGRLDFKDSYIRPFNMMNSKINYLSLETTKHFGRKNLKDTKINNLTIYGGRFNLRTSQKFKFVRLSDVYRPSFKLDSVEHLQLAGKFDCNGCEFSNVDTLFILSLIHI